MIELNKGKLSTSAKSEEGEPCTESGSTTTTNGDQQSENFLKWDEDKCDEDHIIGSEIVSSIFEVDLGKILKPSFEIPKFHSMSHSEGIELLGKQLGMYDLEYNLISYWTVEVLSEVIKKAQSKCMHKINQKMSIIWIVYILMKISLHQLSRKHLFKHLCLLFIRGQATLRILAHLPNPFALQYDEEELERGSEAEVEEEEFLNESISYSKMPDITVQEDEENTNEIAQLTEQIQEQIQLLPVDIVQIRKDNNRDFYQLIKMIYRIFANRFKYAVIWEAFTHPPRFKKIKITDNILIPKISLMHKPPLKVTAMKSKLKTQGKITPIKSKVKPPGNKLPGKQKKWLIKDFSRPIIDPQKEKERKMKNLSKYIRPLREAVDNEFFHQIADSIFTYDEMKSEKINSELEEKSSEKVKKAPQLLDNENASKVPKKQKKQMKK